MSKLWAALRRLLGKKDNGDKADRGPNDVQKVTNRLHPYDDVEINDEGSGVTVNNREPNDVQKVPNRLHPYDDVEIGGDGSGVTVNAQQKRAPRPYDEVGPPDSDGKVAFKDS